MNICVLGGNTITKFAKKSSETDITMYSRTLDEVVTLIVPDAEKVQTIPFALNMCDYVVIEIESIDKFIGEEILFANEFRKPGIIITSLDVSDLIKGTFLETYQIVDKISSLEEVLEMLKKFQKEKSDTSTKILVDQYFKVKGVGDVVLGFVKSGEVKKFDKLTVYPSREECLVKSIQIMSKNVEVAPTGTRVGLALKTNAELRRGAILSSTDIPVVEELGGVFVKNKFYKKDVKGNLQIVVGLQYVSGKIETNRIKFDRPVVMETFGNPIIVIDPNSFPRLAGRFDASSKK